MTVNTAPSIKVSGVQTFGANQATEISGISVSETGNTDGETFTVTLADSHGVLSATRGVQTNGGHTLTFSNLSLSTLNTDLGTLKDTDATAGSDTITVNATDSFGNAATQKTISVTATGVPSIAAPNSETLGVNKALAITGISVSEASNVTGEIFSATVTDTNGVLTATGGVPSNGGHTLTFTGLSFSTLNTDLGTLSDTDGTTGSDSIKVNVSDSEGNSAAQASIAVTVNGTPSIAAPSTATVGVGKSTGISGISVSETGNTTTGGETFTATVTDTNGTLSATGGVPSNGGHTLTFSGLSLATLNSDLATLSDTDGTSGSDTIKVNATDSFGNAATQQTIAVNAVNPTPPTGFVFTPDAATLATLEQNGSDLNNNTELGTFTQSGGQSGDTFTLTIGALGASSSNAAAGTNWRTCSTPQFSNINGSYSGKLYALTVTVNDTTNDTHTSALPFNVVVGNQYDNTITVTGSTPTIVYGLDGNDTINASGMTATTWLVGGAGADTMTGGSGTNTYVFASGDSALSLGGFGTHGTLRLRYCHRLQRRSERCNKRKHSIQRGVGRERHRQQQLVIGFAYRIRSHIG